MTIQILQDFHAWTHEMPSARDFVKGQVCEVSEHYAMHLIRNGKAKAKGEQKAPEPQRTK